MRAMFAPECGLGDHGRILHISPCLTSVLRGSRGGRETLRTRSWGCFMIDQSDLLLIDPLRRQRALYPIPGYTWVEYGRFREVLCARCSSSWGFWRRPVLLLEACRRRSRSNWIDPIPGPIRRPSIPKSRIPVPAPLKVRRDPTLKPPRVHGPRHARHFAAVFKDGKRRNAADAITARKALLFFGVDLDEAGF